MEGPCSSSTMSGQGTLCQGILKHRSRRKYFLLLCSQPAAITGQSQTLQVMISDSSSDTHNKTTQNPSVRFRACNHPPRENLHPALPGQGGRTPAVPQDTQLLCPLTASGTSSLLSVLPFSILSWGSDADPFYKPGAREGLKCKELGLGLPRGAHPFSQCPQRLLGQTTGILSW